VNNATDDRLIQIYSQISTIIHKKCEQKHSRHIRIQTRQLTFQKNLQKSFQQKSKQKKLWKSYEENVIKS
jgi:hypothetical protein